MSQWSELNSRLIWSAIAVLGRPDAYLDLGCGNGAMVQALQSIAHPSLGIELTEIARTVASAQSPHARIILRDLRRPFILTTPFSLVSVVDVADLLPPHTFSTFLNNVVGHVSRWLLWTGRVWARELEEMGMEYCPQETARVSTSWREIASGTDRDWLGDEVTILRRKGT